MKNSLIKYVDFYIFYFTYKRGKFYGKIMKLKYLLLIVFYCSYITNIYAISKDDDIRELENKIFIINRKLDDMKAMDNMKILSSDNIKFNGKIYLEANKTNNKSDTYDILNGKRSGEKFDNIQLKSATFGFVKQLNQYSTFNFKLRTSFNSLKLDTAYLNFEWFPKLTVSLGQICIPLTLEGEDNSNGYSLIKPSRYYTTGNLFVYNGLGAKIKYIGDGFGAFVGIYGNSFNDPIDSISKNIFSFRTYVNPYVYGDDVVHLGINYFNATSTYNKNRRVPGQQGNFLNLQYDLKQRENAGIEFAMNFGSFNFQSEYSRGFITPAAVNFKKKFDVYSYYAQLNFILTGETMEYSEGSFEKIKKVNNPTTEIGGFGAYELTFRFSRTDLQDRKSHIVFDYGKYNEYSVALNWMPVDFVKTILQYSRIEENYKDTYTVMSNKNRKNNDYNVFSLKTKIFF